MLSISPPFHIQALRSKGHLFLSSYHSLCKLLQSDFQMKHLIEAALSKLINHLFNHQICFFPNPHPSWPLWHHWPLSLPRSSLGFCDTIISQFSSYLSDLYFSGSFTGLSAISYHLTIGVTRWLCPGSSLLLSFFSMTSSTPLGLMVIYTDFSKISIKPVTTHHHLPTGHFGPNVQIRTLYHFSAYPPYFLWVSISFPLPSAYPIRCPLVYSIHFSILSQPAHEEDPHHLSPAPLQLALHWFPPFFNSFSL